MTTSSSASATPTTNTISQLIPKRFGLRIVPYATSLPSPPPIFCAAEQKGEM
jgi:hypothetical protein